MKIPVRLRLLWPMAKFLIYGPPPPRHRRPAKLCAECKKPDDKTWYYMVTDGAWAEADLHPLERCCIPCLQQRLGRFLRFKDFPAIPINRMLRWGIQQGRAEEMRRGIKALQVDDAGKGGEH